MGVDQSATVAQAYAIIRLAQWAGDLDGVIQMTERVLGLATSDLDETHDRFLIECTLPYLLSGEVLWSEFFYTPRPFVETTHFRGTVFSHNRVVFELRAYLTNVRPGVADAFSRHMETVGFV